MISISPPSAQIKLPTQVVFQIVNFQENFMLVKNVTMVKKVVPKKVMETLNS